MNLLKNDAGVGLSSKIYSSVIRMLASGELRGGSLIQERKLAAVLGVSRTPLREALGRMEGEGLVDRQGRYLIVRPVTVSDYMHVFAARRLIEGEAAALAAGRIAPDVLGPLQERLHQTRAHFATNPSHSIASADYCVLDDDLHATVARGSGNRYFVEMILALRRRLLLFDVGTTPHRLAEDIQEHLSILEAIALGDSNRARDAMQLHLRNTQRHLESTRTSAFG